MRKRHLELMQKIADEIDKTIDRIKEVETVYETKTVLLKGDKKIDENTRLKTMESFAETKKNSEGEETSPSSSNRGLSLDHTEYLKEISHRKEEQNEQELALRRGRLIFRLEKHEKETEKGGSEIQNRRDFITMMLSQIPVERQAQ